MCKNVFVDKHKRADVVEDCKTFLKKLKELKPYMVEFEEDDTMKSKVYPPNCTVGVDERRLIIVITYDKCTFPANNGIQRAWTQKGDTFLTLKGRRQCIMTYEFLPLYGQLNPTSLVTEKKEEVIQQT